MLIGRAPLADVIIGTALPRLDLAPSAPALAGAEVEMVSMLAREHLLRKALEGVATHYDYVLIDCPPSLGLLTINALTAAHDGVIVPIQCEYLALEGLGRLWHTIQLVRENLNPHLIISGMVLTMYRSAHQSGGPGGRRGAQALRPADVPDGHPAQRPAERGAQLWPDDPDLCADLGRRAAAYAALAQEWLAREEGQMSPATARGLGKGWAH